MNKKTFTLLFIIIVIFVFILYFSGNILPNQNDLPSTPVNTDEEKLVELTDKEKFEKVKNDSYLNILLQIKTFDSLNISYEPLLEAAMRIARELNLYQTPDDGPYIEYVPRVTIHELIYELSGIRIDNPIIIEDFYYLYDSTGDYYYIVPIGSEWLELKDIDSIHYSSTSDEYIIKCSAENLTDYAIHTLYPNVELRLQYKASNTYIKYQLKSIHAGQSTVNVLNPENTEDYSTLNYEDSLED